MSGNQDNFSREQVQAIIRRQGFLTPAMAKHIARLTGRSERNIIAASAAIGNFDPSRIETVAQAKARFVEGSAEQGGPALPISRSARKRISLAIALLIVGLIARWAVGSSASESPTGKRSDNYAQCEAELKPALNRCLQGPQSTWEACGEAYMRELETCTSR
jgi:hypothetical protein